MWGTGPRPHSLGLALGDAVQLCVDRCRTIAWVQRKDFTKCKTALQRLSWRMWGRRMGEETELRVAMAVARTAV